MKRFARRDKMRIYYDVLYAIESDRKEKKLVLTRIQEKANIPFDRLKTYLKELTELGLIQDDPLQLTEKGQQYMIEYEKVQDFMKRMGLAYQT
jgi:predicted transcriptional regulator